MCLNQSPELNRISKRNEKNIQEKRKEYPRGTNYLLLDGEDRQIFALLLERLVRGEVADGLRLALHVLGELVLRPEVDVRLFAVRSRVLPHGHYTSVDRPTVKSATIGVGSAYEETRTTVYQPFIDGPISCRRDYRIRPN